MEPLQRYVSRGAGDVAIMQRQEPVVYPRLVESGEPLLSAPELACYAERGFVFLKQYFSLPEAVQLRREIDFLRKQAPHQSAGGMQELDSVQTLRSLYGPHRYSALIARMASDVRLVGIAQQILGSPVYIHQSRINFKPGFYGHSFFWHSDFETWHIEDGMPHMRAVSCLILLTENTTLNGPLLLIPGSHRYFVACVGASSADREKTSAQQYGIPDADSLRYLLAQGGIEATVGPPGSVLFFDCNLMHGSNSNISPHQRANVFLVYNSIDNRLGPPLQGRQARPEYIAAREQVAAIEPQALANWNMPADAALTSLIPGVVEP